jgi:hypothetical protein
LRRRRALQEARARETDREGGRQEEGGLASCESTRGVDELRDVLLAQHAGEVVDLTGGHIDVASHLAFVLIAHLAAGRMERGAKRTKAARYAFLLRGDLGGRLLAGNPDELAGLFHWCATSLNTFTFAGLPGGVTGRHSGFL